MTKMSDTPQDRSADGVPEVEQAHAPAPTLADDVAALRAEVEAHWRDGQLPNYMATLFDRIAASAPQRATATEHESWWMHGCGYVELHYNHHGTPARRTCTKCDEVSTWRALYVLPDA